MINVKQYSALGWQCFILPPRQKVPTVKWTSVATSEENMLMGWFDNQPSANIGIACGPRSGIVVVDVDAAHEGYESMAELIEKHGALPTTPIALTGGGGEHLFFKYPAGIEIHNSAGKIGKGIDVRGAGGFVVGAGSIHPNGNPYQWILDPTETPLADMPEWMIAKLKTVAPPAALPVASNGQIANGSRNATLTSLAGTMRRKGMDSDSIFAALKIHNQKFCVPPLSDGEVYQIAESIQRYTPQAQPEHKSSVPQITDPFFAIDKLEANAKSREADPRDVWGIHYAWPYLSLITGGKQPGELIYIGGEPGVGKSWWVHQDAMWTAIGKPSENIPPIPTFLWSGEMPPVQVYRRMFEMMGVPKRAMLSGKNMGQCWQAFNEAKAILVNSPLYVSDTPLDISNVRALLEREIGEHGIEQACFDYDWLIGSKGSNEIETSQNISRTFKILARELNISIILISSVNKGGMDTTAQVTKSNLSGSGKKIHDGDIVYILSKLNENKVPLSVVSKYKPEEYWKIVVLNIEKGRDLDYHVPDKKLLYARETPKPSFVEISKPQKNITLESP